jgi:hypothetical protein
VPEASFELLVRQQIQRLEVRGGGDMLLLCLPLSLSMSRWTLHSSLVRSLCLLLTVCGQSPALQCVDFVFEEMLRIVGHCEEAKVR